MPRATHLVPLVAALTGCAAALTGCAAAAPASTPQRSSTMHVEDARPTGTERNKQTVVRLYEECLNQDKSETIAELVAADYTGDRGEKGPSGFESAIRGLRAGVPDIRFTLEELVAEGDRVVVRFRWSGQHTGPLAGFAPTGKHVTTTGMAIYRLRDGQVTGASLLTDRLAVLQQIGAVPALPAPPPPR